MHTHDNTKPSLNAVKLLVERKRRLAPYNKPGGDLNTLLEIFMRREKDAALIAAFTDMVSLTVNIPLLTHNGHLPIRSYIHAQLDLATACLTDWIKTKSPQTYQEFIDVCEHYHPSTSRDR